MKKERTQFFGGYIPLSLYEWGKEQAKKENRSVTNFVINLLMEKKNATNSRKK